MRPLSARQLLTVWEQGLVQTSIQRALSLLAAASPGVSPDSLARLPVGQRDGRLLTLRAWTFGEQLLGFATCPACEESLELTFNVNDIRVAADEDVPDAFDLDIDAYHLRFRLPNSLDMMASASNGDDAVTVRQRLLERCFLAAEQDGEAHSLNRLPSSVITTMAMRMAEADPQADVQTALVCPACDHQWQAAFDIGTFFWMEINEWARRTLRIVNALAAAYGWREADILAMSAWRRQLYLNMVNQSHG